MIKLIRNLLKNEKTKNSNDIILGDGNAEFLGVGTFEEYEKEQETEQTWREYIAKTLKIDRWDVFRADMILTSCRLFFV